MGVLRFGWSVVLAVGALASLGRADVSQEAAVAETRKLGGSVQFDDTGSVVGVSLNNARIIDANLECLKGLAKLETLTLSGNPVTDAGLAHLQGLSNLITLDLCNTKVTDIGLSQLRGLTNLRQLYLSGTEVTDIGLGHLRGLTSLRHLYLVGTEVTDAGLVHLQGLTNLECLSLAGSRISDPGLANLRGLPNLKVLHLSSTRVSDSGLIHLQRLPNLQRLYINYDAEITDAGLAHLHQLTNLRYLRIGFTRVTEEGIKGFRQALPMCETSYSPPVSRLYPFADPFASPRVALAHVQKKEPTGRTDATPETTEGEAITEIKRLGGAIEVGAAKSAFRVVLENTKITDAGLTHLRALTGLQKLDLGGTSITDAGLIQLEGSNSLERLYLDRTHVTDAGLAHLSKLSKLRFLGLDNTRVTDRGLEHLKGLARLGELSLCGTPVTGEGVSRLKQALPNCTIHRADDDAHDRLVYGHCSRQIRPSAVEFRLGMKHAELDHPATTADVAAGRALFSFEGLGEVRVWKLPDSAPVYALWPVLTTAGRNPVGCVCQAEELNLGGKWKRYFGFLCREGAAVVPAVEIDFPTCNAALGPRHNLMQALGITWGMTVPGPGRDFWKKQKDASPEVGDPLPVELHFRNLGDDPLELPLTWFRDARNGGPSLRECLTVSLRWAPFYPLRPDAGQPGDKCSVALEAARDTHFKPDGLTRTLRRAESFQALALDLRDWFKIEREGYYEVCFELKGNSPDLPECLCYHNLLRRSFAIGKPPLQPTVAEFNKKVPMFGGEGNEERLKRVIKETVKRRHAEHKPLPADVQRALAWSEAVGGLAARIEHICDGSTVFVRLKNTSTSTLAVPTGNPSSENPPRLFRLYVQQGEGPWREATGRGEPYCESPRPAESRKHDDLPYAFHGRLVDRPWATLRPGEDCLAVVTASDREDFGLATKVKVVLQQSDTTPQERWTGGVETPPRPRRLAPEQASVLIGMLPFPSHFPPFSYDCSRVVSHSPDASAVEGFYDANRALVDMVEIYDPASVSKEFERRMQGEEILPMKLLLASIAASAGSEEAALFLLETVKDTEYRTVTNLHCALWLTHARYMEYRRACQEEPPPDWLVELSLAVLSDDRFVAGLEKANWEAGTSFTISSCETGHLIFALGELKCRKAVPLLIERAKKGHADWYTIMALGKIGDDRAIPVLMQLVEAAGDSAKCLRESGGLSREFQTPAYALSQLKAREAVPLLLKYIEHPEVINDLEEIGDPRALSAIQKVLEAGGKIIRNGKPVNPELEPERLFAAKVALAHWDNANEIARLGEILADPALERNHRYEVVLRLAGRDDPQVIPHLVRMIKSDSDHYIIDMAIHGLAELKYRAAVEGLIECFDVPFKEEDVGMGEHVTPATYHNHIARSLQRITGQPFGADKQEWLRWWHGKGQQNTELK
jgi:Leucine-rich repeat (LRR) protein/HEAT repeat protein